MAPTLTWIDSFFHQNLGVTSYGTNAGLYDTQLNTAKMSFVAGRRTGTFAVQIVQDATTAARLGKTLAAGNRTVVESVYFKISSLPSVDSNIWQGMSTINCNIGISATTGTIFYNAGSGTSRTVAGNWADGLWHRLDLKWVTSATPFTIDITIDGVAQTQQVSNATTAADITETRLGSNNAAHTATIQFADWVRSVTTGDYPIGPHQVNALVPMADGAHNWASTNMGPAGGGTASSVSTLWQSVDEWPADAADFIQYANTTATSTEYAETLVQDAPTGIYVWAARAVAAILSASTLANSATTRVVDAANATKLDLYVGDQSDTTMRHQAAMIPSVTDVGILNGLKWRVGFPTDSNPAPEWAALLIDYAQAEPSYARKPMSEPLPLIPRGRSM
jgi:hypothetical protein